MHDVDTGTVIICSLFHQAIIEYIDVFADWKLELYAEVGEKMAQVFTYHSMVYKWKLEKRRHSLICLNKDQNF